MGQFKESTFFSAQVDLHAVFFIRNSVKSKLVMFLIYPKKLYGFCFLAEEKMMVFVSKNS